MVTVSKLLCLHLFLVWDGRSLPINPHCQCKLCSHSGPKFPSGLPHLEVSSPSDTQVLPKGFLFGGLDPLYLFHFLHKVHLPCRAGPNTSS